MNSEICECGKNRDKLNNTNWTRHIISYRNPTCSQNEALNSELLSENNLSTCTSSDYTKDTADTVGMDEEVSNSLSTSLSFSQSPILTLKSLIKLSIDENPTCSQNDALNSELLSENNLSTYTTSDYTKDTADTEYQVKDSVFPNDPVHWPETMSNEILTYFVNLGPCQPLPSDLKYNKFPTKNYGSGNIRLFGLDKAKKSFLSSKGTCDYRNIAKTIHHHECLPEHIQIIIDTTTDVSTLEQFTFLLRYLNDKGKIEERLVALVTSPDSTGKGMYEVFCNITEKYNINWKRDLCAQAYDGAASMQGQYSGLKTLIQNENPNALYVWCSAHLLNLVIVDTLVYEKYAALLQSLNAIASAEDSDRESSSTAKSLSMRLSSFEFIIAMNLVKTIFAITTPVSNYLQSKSIDFIEAINLVDVAKNRLIDLRDDDKCQNLINEAKSFAKDQNLTERNFKEVRLRKKKIMPGELSRDEISSTAQDVFRSDVYFKVLDVIINSIESRFKDSREIMKDLCLLSPERLLSYSKKNSKKLPEDAFDQLAKWIHGINLQDLRVEYLAFSSSLHELVVGLEPKQLHENVKCIQSSEDSDSSITSYEDDTQVVEKKVSVERILHILSSYNLISAFPNLYKACKSLGTIPASFASAERSFSKVKLIKTRLRSTTGQDRLESLLILSMEKDIEINYNEAIDTFVMTSDVLKKQLIFK
ncbi:unnamed protein product [Macrosiphum euphorbiae]|uniref:HAT C-terminal dimerisation domain-containing protein n=1 Tax=Macrosiphum euphorbiae TaxID=13131 RepID=A0AAV0VYR9_9HEMI|nr:unnamed protein product [Macrosiphum euphorbiae]